MPLFWIVHKVGPEPVVFIQEGTHKVSARMKALLAGLEGEFSEIHMLDEKMEKRIPKKLRGRPLGQREAAALLKMID